MDVFKIDQQANCQIGSSLVDAIVINSINTNNNHNKLSNHHSHHNGNNNNNSSKELVAQVNCDPSAEFNLNFFDTPDDSSTQGGFSDPGSVESNSVCSPPPIFDNSAKVLVNSAIFENNNCVDNKFFQGLFCFVKYILF